MWGEEEGGAWQTWNRRTGGGALERGVMLWVEE